MLDEGSSTLLNRCGTDDPIVLVFSDHPRLQRDLASFQLNLRISSSDDDDIDSAYGPYEAQLTVPFDAIDDLPLTSGTAPGAQIVGLKVLDDDGRFPSAEPILDAIEWLGVHADPDGITVANASLNFNSGGPNPAVDDAVNRLVEQTGVVFVASARNGQADGIPVASPATARLAIAVGATNVYDQITSYSSLGEEPDAIRPDIVAPGGSSSVGRLVTADSNQAACKSFARDDCVFASDRFRGDYRTYTGTSFAAPQVAGAVALLRQAADTPTDATALKAWLAMTATEVGAGEAASPGPPGRAGEPKDRVEGYGRLNIPAATQAAASVWDDEAEAQEASLSGAAAGRHAWARRVALRAGEGTRFELRVPRDADFDAHLYSTDGSATGEPVALGASATDGAGVNELLFYVSGEDRDAILVVKRVTGDGAFILRRTNTVGPEGCLAPRADLVGQRCTAGVGDCAADGAWVCSQDRMSILCDAPQRQPTTELCGTGADEDCDGVADEGFPLVGTPCATGVGACMSAGAIVCTDDGTDVTCSATAGAPAPELCGNTVDDDCDGQIDEGFDDYLGPCTVGAGACQNAGYWVCSADRDTLTCPVSPLPPNPMELCGNAVDDDCDGAIDEGYDVGAVCAVGIGACERTGATVCDAAQTAVTCDAAAGAPAPEVCGNAVDDDCDGELDEGCSASAKDDGCSVTTPAARPRAWWALAFRRGISAL